MNGKPYRRHRGGCLGMTAGAVLLVAAWVTGPVHAQAPAPDAQPPALLDIIAAAIARGSPPPPFPVPPAPAAAAQKPPAPAGGVQHASGPACSHGIQLVSCPTCSQGLLGGLGGPKHHSGHHGPMEGMPGPSMTFGDTANPCNSGCIPGRTIQCCPPTSDNCVGQFFYGLYECICCPDPCYEPRWLAVADQAFFLDAARPVTQMRFRWDNAWNFRNVDRAEFFQARARLNPNQLGPAGPCAPPNVPGKGPNCIQSSLDYYQLSLYNEAGTNSFSAFTEFGYRHMDPETSILSALAGGGICCPDSNFTDMTVGTKAVLLDCELILLTFQFKTYIPTGDFLSGFGTGHVSLEPSLLTNIKLSPSSYLQGQLAYWIPISGDPVYQGNVYHGHLSLNRILWCPCPSIQLIGNVEVNSWWIQGGAYTNTDFLATVDGRPRAIASPAGATIISAGPGIRLFLCDKVDIGVGSAFALTDDYWEETIIRTEFRLRF